jgi:Zn-dependent metalloprotease
VEEAAAEHDLAETRAAVRAVSPWAVPTTSSRHRGSVPLAGEVELETTESGGKHRLVDPLHGNSNTCDAQNRADDDGPPPVPVECDTFVSDNGHFGDGTPDNRESAAVDAHYGAAMTYEYLKNVHGRDGVFDNGRGVTSRVHYGTSLKNAFWDDELKMMAYGDGAGATKPMVELDIAAHEMFHGVTNEIAGLGSKGEPGGLAEATSDIFGAMVEFYADNPYEPGDYRIGSRVNFYADGGADALHVRPWSA